MIRVLQELWYLPRNLAIAIMKGYRSTISPLYGEVCRYYHRALGILLRHINNADSS